jgi:AbrB family looped-hinge helix DNA binding protein
MLTQMRVKSQITIPREIVKQLGLTEGDQFELTVQDGAIHLQPVTIPKQQPRKA